MHSFLGIFLHAWDSCTLSMSLVRPSLGSFSLGLAVLSVGATVDFICELTNPKYTAAIWVNNMASEMKLV